MNNYSNSIQHFVNQLTDLVHGTNESTDFREQVYANNTLSVHAGALESIFPVTLSILGPANFKALARIYSQYYPADKWDINRYGDQFFLFLIEQRHGPKAEEYDWDCLGRIAQIEYAITDCYYAEAHVQTDLKVLDAFTVKTSNYYPSNKQLMMLIKRFHPYVVMQKSCLLFNTLEMTQMNLKVIIQNSSGELHLGDSPC